MQTFHVYIYHVLIRSSTAVEADISLLGSDILGDDYISKEHNAAVCLTLKLSMQIIMKTQ